MISSTKRKAARDILADPYAAISRFKIVNKVGAIVPLIMNQEQRDALSILLAGENLLVLKARQVGMSTLGSAFLFWKALTTDQPITIAIVSHKTESAKQLFKMYKQFYQSLPKPLQKALSVDNTTEMRFADSGARIIAISAGGDGGLRSFTCNYAHISEYAFSPDPEELMAITRAALNDGQLLVESTANYYGDALHAEVNKALNQEAGWTFRFYPWYDHKEYRKEVGASFSLTAEEATLKEQLNITDEQILWRRIKVEEIGITKFTREYPSTVDEAYAIAGDTLLSSEDTTHISPISTSKEMVLQAPSPRDHYALGSDVSGGVGRDLSTIFILSKTTGEVAYSYRCNQTSPTMLAHKIQEVATRYNNALVLVESNNMGAVVLNELRHLNYKNIWRDEEGKDWLTTSKSKAMLFEALRTKVIAGGFSILDYDTYTELRGLQIDVKGNIRFSTMANGSHSDNVMGLALANIALERIKLKEESAVLSFLQAHQAQKIRNTTGTAAQQFRRY